MKSNTRRTEFACPKYTKFGKAAEKNFQQSQEWLELHEFIFNFTTAISIYHNFINLSLSECILILLKIGDHQPNAVLFY